jgi:hypothetical protein
MIEALCIILGVSLAAVTLFLVSKALLKVVGDDDDQD